MYKRVVPRVMQLCKSSPCVKLVTLKWQFKLHVAFHEHLLVHVRTKSRQERALYFRLRGGLRFLALLPVLSRARGFFGEGPPPGDHVGAQLADTGLCAPLFFGLRRDQRQELPVDEEVGALVDDVLERHLPPTFVVGVVVVVLLVVLSPVQAQVVGPVFLLSDVGLSRCGNLRGPVAHDHVVAHLRGEIVPPGRDRRLGVLHQDCTHDDAAGPVQDVDPDAFGELRHVHVVLTGRITPGLRQTARTHEVMRCVCPCVIVC